MNQHPTPPLTRTRSGGFTLIELLVVITIIGIIGTVVTVNVIQHVDNARHVKAQQMILQIKDALDTYRIHKGSYPKSLDELTQSSKKNGDQPYLKSLPKDPYGNDFVYTADGKDIELLSPGGDRQEGSEDDITLEKIEKGEYQSDGEQ